MFWASFHFAQKCVIIRFFLSEGGDKEGLEREGMNDITFNSIYVYTLMSVM